MANDCLYGLAGAVFTIDIAKAHRVIKKLRAGITWINTYHPTYNEAPWGGYKQSGIGRELDTFGFEEYTEVRAEAKSSITAIASKSSSSYWHRRPYP